MSPEPWLVRAAALRPDRVAIETPAERLTYAELLARAREAAQRLEPGQSVPLTEPAGADFVVALHACLLAGAAAMPVDPRLREAERGAVLAGAGRPTGAALVVHTSGTTGAPRPVELTRSNIEANALGSAGAPRPRSAPRRLWPPPPLPPGGAGGPPRLGGF